MKMAENNSNHICKAHSGFEARIRNCERTNSDQWGEINGMKKLVITTLGSAVLTLLVVLINLLINLAGIPK